MPLVTVIETLLNQPSIPFKPEQQSLKGWVMYCLRDRGFKVVYAQNADFAIETREGDKVYFNVTEAAVDLNGKAGWIVRDRATQQITVISPQSGTVLRVYDLAFMKRALWKRVLGSKFVHA